MTKCSPCIHKSNISRSISSRSYICRGDMTCRSCVLEIQPKKHARSFISSGFHPVAWSIGHADHIKTGRIFPERCSSWIRIWSVRCVNACTLRLAPWTLGTGETPYNPRTATLVASHTITIRAYAVTISCGSLPGCISAPAEWDQVWVGSG